MEIENEAKRAAESAAAAHIAAIEAEQRESEAGLRARMEEVGGKRIAAEQKEATLALQLDELRRVNEAEVAKVKEEAANEVMHIRQIATEAAETRFRDALAAQENALAKADEKARQAESKVVALTDQHTLAMERNLNTQREILEKAREDAVNVEKARAFEEIQRLSTKANDLQRAIDNKSAEELGEGAEISVFEALKTEFPDDKIFRIPKGQPGADLHQVVMLRGKECGSILYDSKNHNQFHNEHVAKLKADQLAAGADHAMLSTHKIVRQHLLRMHTLRLSDIERQSKTDALYEFIISERCSLLLARIDERANDLLDQQWKEIRWHQTNWSKQGEAIRGIQKARVDFENQINSIIGTSGTDSAILEGGIA